MGFFNNSADTKMKGFVQTQVTSISTVTTDFTQVIDCLTLRNLSVANS